MMPERFSNKTNGVTPRRWLLHCNPRLAQAITDAIGDGWTTDLDRLEKLLPLSNDQAFLDRIKFIKDANKKDLAQYMQNRFELRTDPQSMFDVQIKRLHEYKRQLLNALHVVRLYLDAKRDPGALVPRTVLFAAKAAPGYKTAKLIIKLINSIGDVVNADPDLGGHLKVKFLPNYSVSLAERVLPASDLSEQISTAGKEASGTGNMKFAMNGALTIGTLDGANIEIRDAVGHDNFFLFGMTADEVVEARETYDPRKIYEENANLREVLDTIASGFFDREDPKLFQPIVDSLLGRDDFMVLADYQPYIECQKRVSNAYLRQSDWHKKALINIAHMGRFSSDRAIREYARDIWTVPPVPVKLKPYEAP
jgi:starch phosphorylase